MTDTVAQFRLKLKGLMGNVNAPLYLNSFYILGATGVSAISGFIFWIIAARVTSPQDVGVASAALGSVVLLKSIADFGMASSMIYFASSNKEDCSTLVGTTIAFGWISGIIVSLIFVIGASLWAPGLIVFRQDGVLFGSFVIFTAVDSVLSLQDAAMLSKKQGSYVFWRNIACNLPPVLIILVFTQFATDVRSLFLSYTLPNLIVGALLGLIVLPKTFPNYRFWGKLNLVQLVRIGPYGLANHGSNLLWSVPAQALPIITVSVLASDLSGYFLINWTVVNFIFIIPRSVTTSMFVEGSHEKHEVMKISQRSLGIILAIAMPIFLFLWFFSPLVLQLFGKNYSEPRLMKILLLSIFPFSVNAIFFIFLRVLENLRAILAFSAAVAITVLASIFVFAESDNISSIAVGWLVGQMLPCGVALLLYVYSRYAQFSMPGSPDHDMGS